MSGILSELKRRNVIRMAGLYLVGAWLVTQVAATLLPVFDAPGWVMKAVVGLLAVGFIPAMVFAWVFELTPDGLKRESQLPDVQSTAPQTARRMERSMLVLLAIAVAFFLFDRFVLAPKREATSLAAALQGEKTSAPGVQPTITDKSIAVLPFVDMSQARDQEWFGDGLADETLNALARTPDLRVTARTSSFKYKGSNLSVPQIARELGVAHVLEGSIRSTPTRIRVTAQLIRAADGFHVWSQTYDRDPADMITIQEDLARSIATAMQTTMDPKALADMAAVGTRSVEAYQAYLHGRASQATFNKGMDVFRQAYLYFEQARNIDPEFSVAHAAAADYWRSQLDARLMHSALEHGSYKEKLANYQQRIWRAEETAKSAQERTYYRAEAAELDMRWREATALLLEMQKQRPKDVNVALSLADLAVTTSDFALLKRQLAVLWPYAFDRLEVAQTLFNLNRWGDLRQHADQALQLQKRWPDDFFVQYQVHRTLLWDRRVDAAAKVLAGIRELPLGNVETSLALADARQGCAEGRRADVEVILASTRYDTAGSRWSMLMLLGRQREATDLLRALEREGNLYALSGFLTYAEFDPTPFPSLMKILERERIKRPPPVPLPFACPPAGT
ncbi:MAG: hypothetical protein RL030_1032 [Pseudomonadota bacterium]